MRHLLKPAFGILFLGMILVPRMFAAQSASPDTTTTRVYPDSEEGLKSLLENVMAAVSANDESKITSYFSGFEIPEHGAWFIETFGPVEGARLEAKYAELLPEENKRLKKMFDYASKEQRTIVSVSATRKPEEIQGLWRAVMQAMVQPGTLYRANGRNPNQKYDVVLGDFVYVSGGFRFVDDPVWRALSTAPPPRVRQGGNIMAASLTNRVQPVYPQDAKAARVQGTVRLHVVIATDGTVKEIEAMSGDPLLVKSALDAVRQWKYHRTLLNGTPAEVDTTVDVIFALML